MLVVGSLWRTSARRQIPSKSKLNSPSIDVGFAADDIGGPVTVLAANAHGAEATEAVSQEPLWHELMGPPAARKVSRRATDPRTIEQLGLRIGACSGHDRRRTATHRTAPAPIYAALRRRNVQSAVHHADETRWLVFVENKGKTAIAGGCGFSPEKIRSSMCSIPLAAMKFPRGTFPPTLKVC